MNNPATDTTHTLSVELEKADTTARGSITFHAVTLALLGFEYSFTYATATNAEGKREEAISGLGFLNSGLVKAIKRNTHRLYDNEETTAVTFNYKLSNY